MIHLYVTMSYAVLLDCTEVKLEDQINDEEIMRWIGGTGIKKAEGFSVNDSVKKPSIYTGEMDCVEDEIDKWIYMGHIRGCPSTIY